MLTKWTPAHMPEKEEIKIRLQTARSQLYDFQMKIKEHKIPVIVLFEGWGSSGICAGVHVVSITLILLLFFFVTVQYFHSQKLLNSCPFH